MTYTPDLRVGLHITMDHVLGVVDNPNFRIDYCDAVPFPHALRSIIPLYTLYMIRYPKEDNFFFFFLNSFIYPDRGLDFSSIHPRPAIT